MEIDGRSINLGIAMVVTPDRRYTRLRFCSVVLSVAYDEYRNPTEEGVWRARLNAIKLFPFLTSSGPLSIPSGYGPRGDLRFSGPSKENP